MSVQLIVYPQNYDGSFNTISSSSTEFIVNGINFSDLHTSNAFDSTASASGLAPYLDCIVNQPPLINTWQRFRTTSTGTPALPATTSSELVLDAVSTLTQSGVYQKLTNLTVGQNYTVSVISASLPSGKYQYAFFNSLNILNYNGIQNFTTTNLSITITATDTSMTFFLSYQNSSASVWIINSISMQSVGALQPSGATQILENGQVICDLYEDEDLPLSLSVDDFKNVAEKVQSYSKAFKLPATKRNNRIFDAAFEITRNSDGIIFNPYKRTQCVLKQDGFILFEGFLRMLDVTDKEGEISYNVNLYSEVVALADVLKDRTFRELDFLELEHSYNYSNIRNSWQGNLDLTNPLSTSSYAYNPALGVNNTGVLRYPFVDWQHNYTSTATGMPKLPNLESSFRPFITLKYLIDRIFEVTPFTYESSFFNTTDFGKLNMDFNWGTNDTSSDQTEGTYAVTVPTDFGTTALKNYVLNDFSAFASELNYDGVNNRFVALSDNTQYNIQTAVAAHRVTGGADGVFFTLVHKDASGNVIDFYQPLSNNNSIIIPFSYGITQNVLLQQNETLQVMWKCDVAGDWIQQDFGQAIIFASIGSGLATTNSLLQNLRGELNQWDFLKGIINMFNLVTLPDENNPNNILIEPYNDIFIPTATTGDTLANRGIEHDWTDKIDISQIKLNPLTDLNKKTMFKFQEDDEDYAFNQYKNLVGGHLYGSYKSNAGTEFNILDGEDEIIADPFAATVIKPLMSQFPDFITPAIYSMNDDGTTAGFDNAPRIMYNNGRRDLINSTYSIPYQNNEAGNSVEFQFGQFSHLTDIPTITTNPPQITDTRDFNFGPCQIISNPPMIPTVNNLFGMYWRSYFSELYNPNTRTMIIKVNLSPADINTFKFNDTVFIKNRVFRVNKIDYKPNDLATVEFILIP